MVLSCPTFTATDRTIETKDEIIVSRINFNWVWRHIRWLSHIFLSNHPIMCMTHLDLSIYAHLYSSVLSTYCRVGRVTDYGVRGLGFKSPGSILTSRTETSSLSRVVRDGWDPCSAHLSRYKKTPADLRWSIRLERWTATTVQKTTQKQNKNRTKQHFWSLIFHPDLRSTLCLVYRFRSQK